MQRHLIAFLKLPNSVTMPLIHPCPFVLYYFLFGVFRSYHIHISFNLTLSNFVRGPNISDFAYCYGLIFLRQ